MKSLLSIALFGLAYSEDGSGSGSGGSGSGSGGSGGGGGGMSECSYSESFSECVEDGLNGTCVWAVRNNTSTEDDSDCGSCLRALGSCGKKLENSDFNYITFYCQDDESIDIPTDVCDNSNSHDGSNYNDTDTDSYDGGGESGGSGNNGNSYDYSGYNCTDDWDDQGCDSYADWNGTIVATTTAYNLRWLCYGCDWNGGFRGMFPGASIRYSVSAECEEINNDMSSNYSTTATETDGGEASTDRRRLLQMNGDGSGSGSSGSGSGSGSDSGSACSGVGCNHGNGDWSNSDGTAYTITVEVEAVFGSCRALAGVSDTFSDLVDRLEEQRQFDNLTVTVQCSEMDCCEDDDICTSFTICDTDGDGSYDTYDTNGDGQNDISHANTYYIGATFVFATIISLFKL